MNKNPERPYNMDKLITNCFGITIENQQYYTPNLKESQEDEIKKLVFGE